MKFTTYLLGTILSFSVMLLSGCSTNPVSGKKDFVLLSEEQEVSMGKQAHNEISKKYHPYNNAGLQSYVNNIGQRLAQKSHRNNLKYRFTVVDSPEINAFALPGGFIYITRGLMAYLNSEAELAAVLGHEIGHVTARHSVRQQSVGVVADLASTILGNRYGNTEVVGMLGTALTRGYGRTQELEADRLGAEYLARVGYDPTNMTHVIKTLKAQEEFSKALARKEGRQPSSYHGLFSTHPDNDTRLKEIIQAARGISTAGKLSNNQTRYYQQITGLPVNAGDKSAGRIRIIKAKTGDTFAKLAKILASPSYAEARLRLLNGSYPKGEPKAGQLIKIAQ